MWCDIELQGQHAHNFMVDGGFFNYCDSHIGKQHFLTMFDSYVELVKTVSAESAISAHIKLQSSWFKFAKLMRLHSVDINLVWTWVCEIGPHSKTLEQRLTYPYRDRLTHQYCETSDFQLSNILNAFSGGNYTPYRPLTDDHSRGICVVRKPFKTFRRHQMDLVGVLVYQRALEGSKEV